MKTSFLPVNNLLKDNSKAHLQGVIFSQFGLGREKCVLSFKIWENVRKKVFLVMMWFLALKKINE